MPLLLAYSNILSFIQALGKVSCILATARFSCVVVGTSLVGRLFFCIITLASLNLFNGANLPFAIWRSTPTAKAFVVLDYAASMVFVSCCDEYAAVVIECYCPSDFW